jgi:hypothetical protein
MVSPAEFPAFLGLKEHWALGEFFALIFRSLFFAFFLAALPFLHLVR